MAVPSRSTVSRILTRHGLIVAQPQKRPKSATKRFCFSRPNECWQSDWTGWSLADGAAVAIAGTLDDHSRYVPALRAAGGQGTAELVWSTMLAAITECGIPAMSLTDNGMVYTGRLHAFEAAFEANLRALGTHTINSTPSHPQTCGKIERFWQTLKKWLRARPAAVDVEELNALLDQFRDFYNHHRPHRALRGATPAEAFTATAKARPADRPLPAPVFVSRHTVGETSGNAARRALPRQCRTALGRTPLRRHPPTADHIAIFSGTTLDPRIHRRPHRDYQPGAPRPRGPTAHANPNRAS